MTHLLLRIKDFVNQKPLASAIGIGLFLRILSAIFSKGYGMHDDHFVIIEIAQGFVDGLDIGGNLPIAGEVDKSFGSLFYTGLHYIFFKFLATIQIFDPQVKMLFVRILHAFYSLLTIYFGFKITAKLSTVNAAKYAAFILAILWIMPVLSVRNLVETFCIPMLLGGSYFILIGNEQTKKFTLFFCAGILWGLAFSTRFQTIFFTGGAGIILLTQKKWKEFIFLLAGMFLPILIINGIIEGPVIGGAFFSKTVNYVKYNLLNQYNFNTQPWYNYLLLMLGIIMPPASLIIIPSIFIKWKQHLIILFPLVLFFVFHSYFPNKQERFILPIVPYVIILGIAGIENWKQREKYKKIIAVLFKTAFVINLILLFATVTMYSKRSRVEAMYFLYNKGKLNEVVVDNLEYESCFQLPIYYCGQWPHVSYFNKSDDPKLVYKRLIELNNKKLPEYFFFVNKKNLKRRVLAIQKIFPKLKFEKKIEPSNMDLIFHKLNPVNKSEEIYIYKVLKPL